jgi:hypothetical protein
MGFYKTAQTPILGVYQTSGKFHKLARKTADLTPAEEEAVKKTLNLISKDVVKALAHVYNLSDNINDYIFPVPRAVTAGTGNRPRPNNNGDNFEDEELRRFSTKHRCQVYQTFKNDPIHVEHVAFDPKAARGFIPDVQYIQSPEDLHVIVVAAIDTTKDIPLSEGLLSGAVNSWSMGCICDSVRCSYCKSVAHSDNDLCSCLKHHKMSKIGGKLVYEDCLGVEFQELSIVANPADTTALTQRLLRCSSLQEKEISSSFSPIAGVLSKEDQVEVARFIKENINRLPESLLKLANKLF